MGDVGSRRRSCRLRAGGPLSVSSRLGLLGRPRYFLVLPRKADSAASLLGEGSPMKHWLLVVALICLEALAFADHDARVALDRGSYIETSSVTGSSTTGTSFISPDSKRMDGLLFNNTSSTVWIGTTTTTIDGVQHSNITLGIPVLSSSSFKLDGMMSAVLYFTCNVGVSTCNVRVIEGKIR